MCFALQAVSSVGGLAFFLASLHPFTRGVSATFVRSFLTPTVRTAPAAGRGNAIPGYGEGLGGAHRGAALRQALESSTGDRYASAEFLAHTSDIWNWPSCEHTIVTLSRFVVLSVSLTRKVSLQGSWSGGTRRCAGSWHDRTACSYA